MKNCKSPFPVTEIDHSSVCHARAGHFIESIHVSKRPLGNYGACLLDLPILLFSDKFCETESYQLTGLRESFEDPMLEYTVHTLDLKECDQQVMQLDPSFIPSPAVHDNSSHSFRLPVGYSIA